MKGYLQRIRFINRRILKGSRKPFRVTNTTFKLQPVQCKAKLQINLHLCLQQTTTGINRLKVSFKAVTFAIPVEPLEP